MLPSFLHSQGVRRSPAEPVALSACGCSQHLSKSGPRVGGLQDPARERKALGACLAGWGVRAQSRSHSSWGSRNSCVNPFSDLRPAGNTIDLGFGL